MTESDSRNEGPIARATSVLRLLATVGRRGAPLTALAQAAQLPVSTTHRLLGLLIKQRWAARLDDTRFYAIGPLAYELGLAAAAQFDIREVCRPAMQKLSADVGETVYLIQRSGDEAVCIDLVEGPSAVRVTTLQIGSRRPLGLGAGGLAILAALSREESDEIFAAVRDRIESEWRFPGAALEMSLHEARMAGRATISNRITPGVTAIGRSLNDSLGRVFGAVTVASLNARMRESRLPSLYASLDSAAASIEVALRGHSWARLSVPQSPATANRSR